MGHLRHIKQEYRELVHRLEAGQVALPEPDDPRAWEGWREILEILYSPEDAALAAKMPVRPSRIEKISERVGIPPDQLRPVLDRMCERGLVLDLVHPETGAVKYLLAPPVVGFFEFSMMRVKDGIPKKRMAEALDAYVRFDDAFAREVFGGETVIGRTLMHESVWDDEPPPDVLDWERATAIVEDARAHSVSLCYCRHKAEHLGHACDAPSDNCLSLNGGAEFVARRGFGRKIEKAEALDLLHASRERGLVQIADNVMNRPTYICNCCGCCCGQLQGINRYDLPAVNPSGFVPVSDLARCRGCSRCSRACPVTAIAMLARRVDAKRKNELEPRIDLDRCIGCGLCVDACPSDAMHVKRREERPAVPVNTIERSLRMAIERGKLPHLLFDEGEGRGSRFLNRVLQALAALPPAQKALASEQVRSRFVRYALGTVKDPTGG
ncbi:MAG: 4Fe-4S dicluster domain-containing protein [Planctomycetes bacterium]|nr:4Fe-4S dicluster domain-containing protein [Planctomycetota bacterium]